MNNGGPAFPRSLYKQGGQPFNDSSLAEGYGMSLRDYFAAKAMQAIIQTFQEGADAAIAAPGIAEDSYKIADAMLKEREKSA